MERVVVRLELVDFRSFMVCNKVVMRVESAVEVGGEEGGGG